MANLIVAILCGVLLAPASGNFLEPSVQKPAQKLKSVPSQTKAKAKHEGLSTPATSKVASKVPASQSAAKELPKVHLLLKKLPSAKTAPHQLKAKKTKGAKVAAKMKNMPLPAHVKAKAVPLVKKMAPVKSKNMPLPAHVKAKAVPLVKKM